MKPKPLFNSLWFSSSFMAEMKKGLGNVLSFYCFDILLTAAAEAAMCASWCFAMGLSLDPFLRVAGCQNTQHDCFFNEATVSFLLQTACMSWTAVPLACAASTASRVSACSCLATVEVFNHVLAGNFFLSAASQCSALNPIIFDPTSVERGRGFLLSTNLQKVSKCVCLDICDLHISKPSCTALMAWCICKASFVAASTFGCGGEGLTRQWESLRQDFCDLLLHADSEVLSGSMNSISYASIATSSLPGSVEIDKTVGGSTKHSGPGICQTPSEAKCVGDANGMFAGSDSVFAQPYSSVIVRPENEWPSGERENPMDASCCKFPVSIGHQAAVNLMLAGRGGAPGAPRQSPRSAPFQGFFTKRGWLPAFIEKYQKQSPQQAVQEDPPEAQKVQRSPQAAQRTTVRRLLLSDSAACGTRGEMPAVVAVLQRPLVLALLPSLALPGWKVFIFRQSGSWSLILMVIFVIN